jgi:PAS domain S-box-containing protein
MKYMQIESDLKRRKADAQLARLPQLDVTPQTAKELLYELQLHQIELEMQNDELRRAQNTIEESRDRYVDLYDFAPVGYLSVDRDGMIAEINLTGAKLLGVTRDKLVSQRFILFVAWKDRDRWYLYFQSVLASENKLTCELLLQHSDGTAFFAKLDCLCLRSEDETVAVRIVLTDITERKEREAAHRAADQQLHNLATHLQNVREEEKTHIAREIHDELGGTMNALQMKIHQLKMELAEGNNKIIINEQVESMSQMINDAAGITRNIISDLRPSILDDFGLLAAIEWQALQFHKLTGIEYLVNCIGDEGDLDELHSIAIFRILQEALTNVTKHSGANRVEIEYHHSVDEVLMTVSDNGKGILDGQEVKSGGFGILGMRERVKQLGGTIRFDSPAGGGLCLMVAFPLAATLKI